MIVHVNGELVPAAAARVSVFDRGFLFGDGIYEGLRSTKTRSGRRVIGLHRHEQRLADGLKAAGIEWNAFRLGAFVADLLKANELDDAFTYWQVTRGTPPPGAPVRARVPAPGMRPTAIGFCTPLPALDPATPPAAKAAATVPDRRWLEGGVKSISLIGNIMSAMAAATHGGEEAILIRDVAGRKLVTEGTYTNVLIVCKNGELATPSLDSAPLLPGVTRRILVELEPSIVERPVDAAELADAREILLVGTTTMVTSVVQLDGRPIHGGKPGPEARRLLKLLVDAIIAERDDLPTASDKSKRS